MHALMFSKPKTCQKRNDVSGVTCQDGFGHEVLHDGFGPASLHDCSRHVGHDGFGHEALHDVFGPASLHDIQCPSPI